MKILLGSLSLAAVTLIFGLLARGAQSQFGEIAFRLYDDGIMSISYLRSAQNALLATSRDLLAGGVGTDALHDRLQGALDDLAVAHDRALSPQGAGVTTELRDWLVELDRAMTEGRPDLRAQVSSIENRFDVAVEIFAGDGFRSRRSAASLVAQTQAQTWGAMGVALIVALLITALLSRAIVPSLRHAVGIATAIADGKLDNPIEARGQSETAVLLRALASMQRSIADKIARIEELMAAQASDHALQIAIQLARFETALENMVQGLCMFDENGRLLVHNRRFGDMFGVPEVQAEARQALPPEIVGGGPTPGTRSFTCDLEDGRTIAVVETAMATGGWLATYEDVTERHRAAARMAHMARHDALTGLPNRVLYREQMDHALAQVRRGGGLAVLCLDLDHFKSVNDTLGHPVGDKLLQAVASRLLAETREADMVVRLGGDEFAIIQLAPSQPRDAKLLAERLVAALGEPFTIDDHQIAIGTSIGIAVTTIGQESADHLLKCADLALYRAKADGRATFRFFEAEMDARMQARRRLELDLRKAVAEQQFLVFYQPLVDIASGQVNGFEALVRWKHPEHGVVSPAEFIPIAEETGLIVKIGSQVLRQACRDAATWPAHVHVAVNLSPAQFRNRALAAEVKAALDDAGIPPSRLELEITESLLLQDSEGTLAILLEIRALGVRISMDDFGTGYSSLSYLRRFPFDKIKIDQSFIRNLDERGDCLAIVRAVLGLGRSLGMSVIAEGVETGEQLALLQQEGCQQAQGYLFSRPQPAAAVASLLEASPATA